MKNLTGAGASASYDNTMTVPLRGECDSALSDPVRMKQLLDNDDYLKRQFDSARTVLLSAVDAFADDFTYSGSTSTLQPKWVQSGDRGHVYFPIDKSVPIGSTIVGYSVWLSASASQTATPSGIYAPQVATSSWAIGGGVSSSGHASDESATLADYKSVHELAAVAGTDFTAWQTIAGRQFAVVLLGEYDALYVAGLTGYCASVTFIPPVF